MRHKDKPTPIEHARKILGIPKNIHDIVMQQTSSFRNFSPTYILNHYKITEDSDMVVGFHGGDVSISKNKELFEKRQLAEHRITITAMIMEKLKEKYPELVKDLNLLVPMCIGDMSDNKLQHIPCLAYSKNSFSNAILIPNLQESFEYQNKEDKAVYTHDRPLMHKQNKMCFVGSFTNVYWNNHGMQYNQRLQMAWMAMQAPDLWECTIVKPPKYDDAEWESVVKQVDSHFPGLTQSKFFNTGERDPVDIETQLKNKFQICVDGHTCAWGRFPWQMLSNSVIFKIRNPQDDFMEWYYPLLQNGKHFLEVDTHNLIEAFQYMIHEPEHQIEINDNATDFASNYFFNEDLSQRVLLYTLLILNQKQTLVVDNNGD